MEYLKEFLKISRLCCCCCCGCFRFSQSTSHWIAGGLQ